MKSRTDMDIQKLKKLPKEAAKFENGDVVNTPVGKMVVVENMFGHTLDSGTWIPNVRLGFIKKDKTLNTVKKHRTFSQSRLTKAE